MSCVFCDLLKSKKDWVYETNKCCCFKDINPRAPVHLLIIPKLHIESLLEVNRENVPYVEDIFLNIPDIVKKLGLKSYRLVSNTGIEATQSVFHLHFHIMGGTTLEVETWDSV